MGVRNKINKLAQKFIVGCDENSKADSRMYEIVNNHLLVKLQPLKANPTFRSTAKLNCLNASQCHNYQSNAPISAHTLFFQRNGWREPFRHWHKPHLVQHPKILNFHAGDHHWYLSFKDVYEKFVFTAVLHKDISKS